MNNREKVIKGLEHCSEDGCKDCPYESDCTMCDGFSLLAKDALALLKEREGYVSIPFSWLVKFCTHIDFKEPASDQERELLWRGKLDQQFGMSWI